MKRWYQRTFDQVRMPEERARSMRAALASRCSGLETEVITMKKQKVLRRPITFLAAVLLIAALSVTALACGGRVIYQIIYDGIDDMENKVTFDLTEQEPDFVLEPYEYVEEDGEIIVSFD